jgi:hypothetical protein
MFASRRIINSVVLTASRSLSVSANKVKTSSNNVKYISGFVAASTFVVAATYPAAECSWWPWAASLDINAVKADIINAIAADEEKREDGSSIQGTLVRLAWY